MRLPIRPFRPLALGAAFAAVCLLALAAPANADPWFRGSRHTQHHRGSPQKYTQFGPLSPLQLGSGLRNGPPCARGGDAAWSFGRQRDGDCVGCGRQGRARYRWGAQYGGPRAYLPQGRSGGAYARGFAFEIDH